jgi:hypothetical protein
VALPDRDGDGVIVGKDGALYLSDQAAEQVYR